MTKDLINRITYHLSSGGLFNPELADHLAVRNLLMECREALAQPEQDGKCKYCTDGCPACDARKLPEQEPVAFICEFYADEGHPFVSFEPVTHGTNTPLYTTPPQRKPLTDEEINRIAKNYALSNPTTPLHFARAIEAAHGIKGET